VQRRIVAAEEIYDEISFPQIRLFNFPLQGTDVFGKLRATSFTEDKETKKMVKIRMRRTGCRNHAAYRIVAADERSPRDGKFLEILGWYDTQIKDNNFKLDLERVDHWLQKGAKPSATLATLIRRARNPELKPHHARKAKKAEAKA
jgi:small subunit ribosomal protein S16